MTESTAKTTNNCKLYVFNHVDAFYENADGYRPRKPLKLICDECAGQMKLDLMQHN